MIDRLKEYDYPGNVRELINIVERMMIMSEGERLCAEDLPEETLAPACAVHLASDGTTLRESVRVLETRMIRSALEKSPSLATAAESLAIHPTTLWRKMARYGIAPGIAKLK